MPSWPFHAPTPSISERVSDVATSPIVVVSLGLCVLVLYVMGWFSYKKHFVVENKHVIITGGSQGLGLGLAELVFARGAHVTIMARTVSKLEEAVKGIEGFRTRATQRLAFVSVDMRDPEDVRRAFDEACAPFSGAAPDIVIGTAGAAGGGILGFFTEMSVDDFRKGWETNYMTALWTAREAARRMARQHVKGHIVLVSSVAGLFGFTGYSGYSPAKMAIRALADCLRMEFKLYGISMHVHFPGGIDSPGFVEEQKCKPEITKLIEGSDSLLKPRDCAKKLLKGLDRGEYFIATDFNADLFINSEIGASPRSNAITGLMYGIIATIGLPIFRRICDRQTRQSSKDHLARLQEVKQ